MTEQSPDSELKALADAYLGAVGPPHERLRAALADIGLRPSLDAVRFACQELGGTPTTRADIVRLAFFALSTHRDTAVESALQRASVAVISRLGGLLRPYVDADDLSSRLRERVWAIPATKLNAFAEQNNIQSLLTRVARWLASDELRAMTHRQRLVFSPELIDAQYVDPSGLDDVLDVQRLLSRLDDEVPEWARDVVIAALFEQHSTETTLEALNERRLKAGLNPLSPTGMRVWMHRIRKRLRELAED